MTGGGTPSQIQSERRLGKNGSKKLICEPFICEENKDFQSVSLLQRSPNKVKP